MSQDSTGKPYANPKFETIFEMGRRIYNSKIGIVSTAYLADATPAAVVAHTSLRSQYDLIIDQYLDGVTSNFSWTKWDGPDVLFGGGGSDFVAKASNRNVSKIDKFLAKGYEFVTTNSSLHNIGNSKRALGLFSASTLPTWVDRHVFPENLPTFKAYNEANKTFTAPTTDVPGLKEMTLKALDILTTRSKADGTNFMLMSEAASIDKGASFTLLHRITHADLASPLPPSPVCSPPHPSLLDLAQLCTLPTTLALSASFSSSTTPLPRRSSTLRRFVAGFSAPAPAPSSSASV